MSGLPWYKCDPAKFNDGMIGLSRAERGVYVTVLNAIYIEGGPVKDDPVYWASVFGCSQAQWAKDRGQLIAKGKLFCAPTEDGIPGLMNRRAAEELEDQRKFRSEQAARGAKGGSKSRRKARADKGLSRASASAKRPLSDRLATAKESKREREILSPSREGTRNLSDSSSDGVIVPLGRERGR